jgi:branched-chain amino acid transport system permease protein
MMLLAAILVGVVVGPLIERGLLRFMYGRDEIVLVLVTYAVFLILEDFVKLVWGVEPYFLFEPYSLLGSFDIGGLTYPTYNLVMLGAALALGGALYWVLSKTRQGRILIAVIHDREMAAALGVNVGRVYFITFTIGAMLGALGGALSAPMISVQPGIGVEVIVLAFAVVVIGGLGSLAGAALGAMIVGLVRSAAVHYLPEVELFSIYLVMAAVLILRPKGLFSAAEARKI